MDTVDGMNPALPQGPQTMGIMVSSLLCRVTLRSLNCGNSGIFHFGQCRIYIINRIVPDIRVWFWFRGIKDEAWQFSVWGLGF